MTTTEHVMEIGTDFILGDWMVECSCGWGGPQVYARKAEAVDAWDDHCDAVFMEATGG